MKTYFIVEHNDRSGQYWRAHRRGILSSCGIYNVENWIPSTTSFISADDCEKKLRRDIVSPKVIKVVRI